MKSPIAIAVFVALLSAGAGANAACPPHPDKSQAVKSHQKSTNCVDLNGVPQITSQVVAGEPAGSIGKVPGYEPPTATKYEGPTLGLTKPEPGVRPTPTVGYHWNLE